MARSRTKQKRRPVRRRARMASAGALPVFAHEVRTSLTGVLALGELLARSDLGARERQWEADIKTSAEHLAALTTLVVDAAKADATTNPRGYGWELIPMFDPAKIHVYNQGKGGRSISLLTDPKRRTVARGDLRSNRRV